MKKQLLSVIATLFLVLPAGAANWHCGYFTKYQPNHPIFGIIGDLQNGPAIVKQFTKDPKNIKKFLQHGNCYCVKGNLVYTKQFGPTFKKMNQIGWCPNYDHPAGDPVSQ